MRKEQLFRKLAERMGISNKLAKAIVDEFFASIESALMKGEAVTLRGLGKFQPRVVYLKRRRNPKTGEYLPGCRLRKISFRPAIPLNNIE